MAQSSYSPFTQHTAPAESTMDAFFMQNNLDWPPIGMTTDGLDMMTPKYPMKDSIPHIHHTEPDLGAVPMIQTFYEGPPKCDCCSNWIEKAPVQLPEDAKERYDGASIRVFKTKDHDSHLARIGGLVAVKDDTIELQGKLLVNFLRPILAEVGFIPPLKTKIIFKAPFRELYFAYGKIVQAATTLDDTSDVRRHVGVLLTTIGEIFADTVKQVTDLLSRQFITFEYLWTLFPKHAMVYLKELGGNRAYEVTRTEYIDTKLIWREKAKNERVSKPDMFQVKFRSFMQVQGCSAHHFPRCISAGPSFQSKHAARMLSSRAENSRHAGHGLLLLQRTSDEDFFRTRRDET